MLDWDSPQSQDVVLRKKCESGEEVAVSALLGPETFKGESSFPREALMKVCIKKPGLSSILQFDCGVSSKGDDGSELDIHNAYYIPSSTSLDSSIYKAPSYRYTFFSPVLLSDKCLQFCTLQKRYCNSACIICIFCKLSNPETTAPTLSSDFIWNRIERAPSSALWVLFRWLDRCLLRSPLVIL